ncbi:MAG: hypothetical protein KGH54_00910 [Candidatus Micrarchaeota archaeon]|nr:hypothetical protein [Candidatus Micrarchaeota archaeon]
MPTLVKKFDMLEVTERGLETEIKNLEDRFIKDFGKILRPGTKILQVEAAEITPKINRRVEKVKENQIIVGLDKVYADSSNFILDITRNTDLRTGNFLNMVERYGALKIKKQFQNLKKELKKANQKGIILVDGGSCRGITIEQTAKLLEKSGIQTDKIILGFSTDTSFRYLNNLFPNKLESIEKYDVYEWTELRDVALIDGKTVPPQYSINNRRTYRAYFETLEQDASIPTESVEIGKRLCYGLYQNIMNLLRDNQINAEAKIGGWMTLIRPELGYPKFY